MKPRDYVASWGKILRGRIPLLSIEITRECPLRCPGCYAYGDAHLGGEKNLRDVSDLRGDELVQGIYDLVEKHDPVQVSLVGGEPLVRHRELSKVLPMLSAKGTFSMVVTSAVIPIPMEWMTLPRVTVAVSVDGLQPEHDERRKPATYEKILQNIHGRRVNIHWTIVRQHMERPGYLDEYLALWSAQAAVNRIWVSLYTPQRGEESPERLTPANRLEWARLVPELRRRYPKLLIADGMGQAFVEPPASPSECIFSRMSVNYTADFQTRVEPCIFGGDPDCSQCGCAISAGLHWAGTVKPFKPLPVTVGQLVWGSMAVGAAVNRVRKGAVEGLRWTGQTAAPARPKSDLVQIK